MTRKANLETGLGRRPRIKVTRIAGLSLFALLALAVLLVAVPGRVNAQPIDRLTDYLYGGTLEDAFLPQSPQLALEPDEQSSELADRPQSGPEGAPQRAQFERHGGAGWRAESAGDTGSVGYRPMFKMLKVEDQRKLADLRISFLKQAGPLESDLKVKAAEFAALWLADEPNEDQIVAKAKEIAAVREQLMELRLRNRIALLKILPPEFRTRLTSRAGPTFLRRAGHGRFAAHGGGRGFGGMTHQQ
jgi:Spy/CpxP family protein refolding chaperone